MLRRIGIDGTRMAVVLVILSVVLLVAFWVVRITHEGQLIEFDNRMWRTLGIPPELGRAGTGVVVLLGIVVRAVLKRVRGRRRLP